MTNLDMKNEDVLTNPINYLEMLFGRFVSFGGTLDEKRMNYFIFFEIVNAFYATSAFNNLDDVNKASWMVSRLQETLNLSFDD